MAALIDSLNAHGLLGNYFGTPGHEDVYDYVIVGGGTAGLVLAHRLSEKHTVAVVEAGGLYELDNGPHTQIPAPPSRFMVTQMAKFENHLIDWGQTTSPQDELAGRVISYASGKTLGGGSARNSLWYQKSCASSYDKWADEVGDDTYKFCNFDEFFKKSATFHPPDNSKRPTDAQVKYATASLSTDGGPLQVGYPAWVNATTPAFANSLHTLGFEQLHSFIDGKILGWSFIPTTRTRDHVRSTSSSSYLREALERGHRLKIFKQSIAKRIILDDQKLVSGVLVESGGPQYSYTLRAAKEVIVCAGAFRSPQLLMVSGIGPRATLESHHIPVVSDLSGVGQNLWDHLSFNISTMVNVPTHSRLVNDADYAEKALHEYNTSRTGIFTNTGADILAFERLPSSMLSASTRLAIEKDFPEDWPTVEYALFDGSLTPPSTADDHVTALAVLMAPFSRGHVTIDSADTATNPIVNPRWLLDKRDHEVAIACFRRLRLILGAGAMAQISDEGGSRPSSDVETDEQILEYIKGSAFAICHSAGTCAMGKAGDPKAVTDSRGRVFGVSRLRVVDASSFPSLPPGHPQGTIYALAEKIAEDILRSV